MDQALFYQTIRIVDNNAANIIDITQPITNVVQVAAPGPQGIQGLSAPFNNLGNNTQNTTNDIQITGSLKVTGSLYMNGNRQFNYGAFSDTTDQTLAAGISGSFTYDTVELCQLYQQHYYQLFLQFDEYFVL